ncbi:MAG: hypothetical protein Q9167_002904 [Letrouitia subvulpina]
MSLKALSYRRTTQLPCIGTHCNFGTAQHLKTPERRPSHQLPTNPARTRFAPSPTGNLHLGSLRTALFNYLLAKATSGQFLLRIEDTDKTRTAPYAEQRLYEDLTWAGLKWDEGPDIGGPYGPYKQSERTLLYQQHAEKLLRSGHAYRCFCSSDRLNTLAKQRNKLGLHSDYDRACEGIPVDESNERAYKKESHVVRLKVARDFVVWNDLVYGRVGRTKQQKEIIGQEKVLFEDPILLKSDGLPTYHLANVVDDHFMKITHVIRAAEWMSSTPKHLILYQAFGWQSPAFAHVGLLQNQERQKYSKRKGDLDIQRFKEEGIFPEALLNYVALYGWSHTRHSDFFTLSDLIEEFDLKFTKGNTIVQPHKLIFLQRKYSEKIAAEGGPRFDSVVDQIFQHVQQELQKKPICEELQSASNLKNRVINLFQLVGPRYVNPLTLFNDYEYFFRPLDHLEYKSVSNPVVRNLLEGILPLVRQEISVISSEDWDSAVLKTTIQHVVDTITQQRSHVLDETGNDSSTPGKIVIQEKILRSKSVYKAVHHYLRWAIAFGRSGPPMHDTMAVIGRKECIQRLANAEKLIDTADP